MKTQTQNETQESQLMALTPPLASTPPPLPPAADVSSAGGPSPGASLKSLSPSGILKKRGGEEVSPSPRGKNLRVSFDLAANTNHIMEPLSDPPEVLVPESPPPAPAKPSWKSPPPKTWSPSVKSPRLPRSPSARSKPKKKERKKERKKEKMKKEMKKERKL